MFLFNIVLSLFGVKHTNKRAFFYSNVNPDQIFQAYVKVLYGVGIDMMGSGITWTALALKVRQHEA